MRTVLSHSFLNNCVYIYLQCSMKTSLRVQHRGNVKLLMGSVIIIKEHTGFQKMAIYLLIVYHAVEEENIPK